jgi:hypothetical protein
VRLDALTMAFDMETAGKNRKSIVEALKTRIAELQGIQDAQEFQDENRQESTENDKTTGDDE